jgi:hypothetical protein
MSGKDLCSCLLITRNKGVGEGKDEIQRLSSQGRQSNQRGGKENTEGVDVDSIRSIDKIRISRRKSLTLGILSVIFIGSLVSGLGSGSLITELVAFGSFILIATTVASVFVTDRYEIKTQNDEMKLSVRGAKGHRFMGEVQQRAGPHVDAGFSYGDQGDPFVGSARRKQMNFGIAILVVIGAVLGAAVAAPVYSDNITWEGVTDVVEAVGDDGSAGDSTSDTQAVYESDEDENVFSSEYATAEFSQGNEDLDRSDAASETYVNIDFTPLSEELYGVYVEVPASQNMETEQNIDELEDGETYEMGYTVTDENEEWVRADIEGELENSAVVRTPSANDHSYLDETQTLRPGIGTPSQTLGGGSLTNMEANTDKFIKGAVMTNVGEFDPNSDIEYPNVVGFEQGDRVNLGTYVVE